MATELPSNRVGKQSRHNTFDLGFGSIGHSSRPKPALYLYYLDLLQWQIAPRPCTLTFNISQLPSPKSWAMAGGSDGYRAALVRRQLTPGLISSLPETAALQQFISFSTSYPELEDFGRSETGPCRVVPEGD